MPREFSNVGPEVSGFRTSFTFKPLNRPAGVSRHRSDHVSRHRSLMCHDIVHLKDTRTGKLGYDILTQPRSRSSHRQQRHERQGRSNTLRHQHPMGQNPTPTLPHRRTRSTPTTLHTPPDQPQQNPRTHPRNNRGTTPPTPPRRPRRRSRIHLRPTTRKHPPINQHNLANP